MKLAEALNARKTLEARLARLEERLDASARTEEGFEPPESPESLYAEVDKTSEALGGDALAHRAHQRRDRGRGAHSRRLDRRARRRPKALSRSAERAQGCGAVV